MMKRTLPLFFLALGGFALASALGCETLGEPTEATVVNAFPADDPAPYTVVKVWLRTTLYLDPLAPGAESEALRVGTGREPAYALLARGYDPSDPDAGPPVLIAARTRDAVALANGETARVVLSASSTLVGCGGPGGLSPEDHAFISERIFPGEAIEPCSATPSAEGGADAGTD